MSLMLPADALSPLAWRLFAWPLLGMLLGAMLGQWLLGEPGALLGALSLMSLALVAARLSLRGRRLAPHVVALPTPE